jgi:hypothetical protein
MTEEPKQLDLEDYLGELETSPRALQDVAAKALKTAEAKRQKASKPPTRAHLKLIDAAVEIGMERPSAQDAAYMARELVQCTLPHKNPGNVPLWRRTNGSLTLGIQPGMNMKTGESYGYPYGTLPRLLLFWITTEAVRTQTRRLELGNSLAGFMHELGLSADTGGGPRGDARRLRDQMQRLFRSRISFERDLTRAIKAKGGSIKQQHGQAWLDMQVAPDGELWWDEKDPEQPALWGSWIELGDKFFQAITAAPVPVDIRALRALKRSPLALDLYAWLTHESYRAHKSGQGRFVAWPFLMEQLGAEYREARNFQTKSREALRKVATVYPTLKLGSLRAGVRIDPESFPAIQPKPSPIIEI